jgi:hypothetical protein
VRRVNEKLPWVIAKELADRATLICHELLLLALAARSTKSVSEIDPNAMRATRTV